MKKNISLRFIRIRTTIVLIVSFLIVNAFIHVQFYNQRKEAKLNAEYTAE